VVPNNPLSYTPATFPLGMADHLAAPFWCDIATQSGTITFGSTDTDTALLARANDDVRNAYPFDAFTADEIFVATWSMVTATGGNPAQVCEKTIMLCRILLAFYISYIYTPDIYMYVGYYWLLQIIASIHCSYIVYSFGRKNGFDPILQVLLQK